MKKDKFSVGEKVFLIHLHEEAIVRRVDEHDDLLFVETDGMEIPVYAGDVSKTPPASDVSQKHDEPSPPLMDETPARPVSPSNSGITLSFAPVHDHTGDITSFNIQLINDSAEAISFDYYFFTGSRIHFALKNDLREYAWMPLHTIPYDLLNESPAFEVQVAEAREKRFSGKLIQKIKPQSFFKKLSPAPLTGQAQYNYFIKLQFIHKPTEVVQPSPGRNTPLFDAEQLRTRMLDSPDAAARMRDTVKDKRTGRKTKQSAAEIDLHIEALTRDYQGMTPPEMLDLQLRMFRKAMDQAISHGAHVLYVIHGVGKGKLKKEIHRLLRDYQEVHTFHNHPHPRYGTGATEVIFRQ